MRRLLYLLPIAAALVGGAAASTTGSGFSPTPSPVSPDGVRAIVDLPAGQHIKNVGGSDGAGLCVFTSIEHAARWQNVRELDGFQQWMRKRPGGGWPEKLDQMVAAYAREKGAAAPTYIQHTGGDDEFLEAALKTDRMPCVTYAGQDDFYRSKIAHMVNLAHLDSQRAAIIDNNRPGAWVWMTRSQFLSRWRDMQGGWAVVFVAPPPPSHTTVPAQQVFGEAAGGKCVCGDECKCAEQGKTCPGGCPVKFGQCGPGGCPLGVAPVSAATRTRYAVRDLPAATTPPRADPRAGPNHLWKYVPGLGDQWIEDNGGPFDWGQRADGSWGWVAKEKAEAVPAAQAVADNYGVESGKIHTHPAYSINGVEVTRPHALAAIGGPLADDSDRWHLTAVGDAVLVAKFKADVAGLPDAVRSKLLVQGYGPADWPVAFFKLPGGVCLRKPSPGRVSEQVGAVAADQYAADKLADLLAAPGGPLAKPAPPKPDEPKPDQPKSPDPAPPGSGQGGVILLIIGGVIAWLLYRRQQQA